MKVALAQVLLLSTGCWFGASDDYACVSDMDCAYRAELRCNVAAGRCESRELDAGATDVSSSAMGSSSQQGPSSVGGLSGASSSGGTTSRTSSTAAGSSSQAGSSSSAPSSAASCSCGSLETCVTGTCVARAVPVAGYTIDATEVTRGQYEAWLARMPSTSGQGTACTWNNSFVPTCTAASLDRPVTCVDWCDARAFCAYFGKRLCGAIGGGATSIADYNNAATNQWYRACSSNDANDYPYGDTYEGTTCSGHGTSGTVPVGSLTGCTSSVTGYTGVYDLSGNAWEWEDNCDGNVDGSNKCQVRGGAYSVTSAGVMTCSAYLVGGVRRDNRHESTGFRCCSNP